MRGSHSPLLTTSEPAAAVLDERLLRARQNLLGTYVCSSRTFMNGSGIGRASSFVCLYGHMAMDDTTNSMQIVYSRPRIYDEEEAVTRGVASIVAQRTVGDRGWDPVTAWCSSRIRGLMLGVVQTPRVRRRAKHFRRPERRRRDGGLDAGR